MKFLQGAASLVAGFLLLPVLMRLSLGTIFAVVPDLAPTAAAATSPSVEFMATNLGLTAIMAALSACLTARLAPEPRYLWVLLLAFFVFVGGLVFGVQQLGAGLPTWYLLGLPLVSGVSIAAGGWLFLWWWERKATGS